MLDHFTSNFYNFPQSWHWVYAWQLGKLTQHQSHYINYKKNDFDIFFFKSIIFIPTKETEFPLIHSFLVYCQKWTPFSCSQNIYVSCMLRAFLQIVQYKREMLLYSVWLHSNTITRWVLTKSVTGKMVISFTKHLVATTQSLDLCSIFTNQFKTYKLKFKSSRSSSSLIISFFSIVVCNSMFII